MLYPKVKIYKEHAICTCGAQNYRTFHSDKPVYRIFEVEIQKPPCGSVTFFLCQDCIGKMWKEATKDGSSSN